MRKDQCDKMKQKMMKARKQTYKGAHVLLSDKPEWKINKSDHISDDHHKANASNLANPSHNQQHPDFPRIDFNPHLNLAVALI